MGLVDHLWKLMNGPCAGDGTAAGYSVVTVA